MPLLSYLSYFSTMILKTGELLNISLKYSSLSLKICISFKLGKAMLKGVFLKESKWNTLHNFPFLHVTWNVRVILYQLLYKPDLIATFLYFFNGTVSQFNGFWDPLIVTPRSTECLGYFSRVKWTISYIINNAIIKCKCCKFTNIHVFVWACATFRLQRKF